MGYLYIDLCYIIQYKLKGLKGYLSLLIHNSSSIIPHHLLCFLIKHAVEDVLVAVVGNVIIGNVLLVTHSKFVVDFGGGIATASRARARSGRATAAALVRSRGVRQLDLEDEFVVQEELVDHLKGCVKNEDSPKERKNHQLVAAEGSSGS